MNRLKQATLVLVALALSGLSTSAAAQQPTVDELIRTIESSQSIRSVLRHLRFEGCPQGDEEHRQAFEGVSRANLPPAALAELSLLWSDVLEECGYQPLEEWFERSLARLTESDDALNRQLFVMHLPTDISEDMRAILWRFVESRASWNDHVTMLAYAAVDSSTPAERLARSLTAFRDRRLSLDWIQGESATLLQQQRSVFLRALARNGDAIADDRLDVIVGNVAYEVRAGRLDPADDALAELRARVRNRPGISEEMRGALGPN